MSDGEQNKGFSLKGKREHKQEMQATEGFELRKNSPDVPVVCDITF